MTEEGSTTYWCKYINKPIYLCWSDQSNTFLVKIKLNASLNLSKVWWDGQNNNCKTIEKCIFLHVNAQLAWQTSSFHLFVYRYLQAQPSCFTNNLILCSRMSKFHKKNYWLATSSFCHVHKTINQLILSWNLLSHASKHKHKHKQFEKYHFRI